MKIIIMKIFDKADWHIDGGEDKDKVILKFKNIYEFLKEKELLSPEGLENLDFGIDSSISLNEMMVTDKGYKFLDKYYDKVINFEAETIKEKLEEKYKNL